MLLTVIAMVKNESEVIADFCSHLSEFFDRIIILDHQSIDGTKEYLYELSKKYQKFSIMEYGNPGYFQSEAMTYIAKTHKFCAESDWVFILDADEILPFSNRLELESKLVEHKFDAIISMPWINLIPFSYSETGLLNRKYLFKEKLAEHHKIAYQPKLLPTNNYKIAQGNHAILTGLMERKLPAVTTFPLYHVPIRSSQQLGLKLIQGIVSYMSMGDDRDTRLGVHWFNIAKYLNMYGMTDSMMNAMISHYGERIDDNKIEYTKEELYLDGYQEKYIGVNNAYLPEVTAPINNIEVILKTVTSAILKTEEGYNNFSADYIKPYGIKDKDEDNMKNVRAKMGFTSLPKKQYDLSEGESEFICNFIEPANKNIETLTPTAWGGHIPFLFCVINALQPRIYVELGSHYGASFFAACQQLKDINIESTAVAIDLWEGDDHTGAYDETVYDNFMFLLNERYSDIGVALRMDFNEAVSKFPDKSIDLLHIDGLHTYEAVKNDYETWKSKLTDNGVILFHDTNEYERNFGVWKLWDEISNDYLSFNFKHTHGLGVIALGDENTSPVAKFLNLIYSKKIRPEFVENYFSRMGELSTFEAFTIIQNNARKSSKSQAVGSQLQGRHSSIKSIILRIPILRNVALSIWRFVKA